MLPHLGHKPENPTCSVLFELAEFPEFYEKQKHGFTPLPKFPEHPEFVFSPKSPAFSPKSPEFSPNPETLDIQKKLDTKIANPENLES